LVRGNDTSQVISFSNSETGFRKTRDGSDEFFRTRVSTATGTAFIFTSVALLGALRRTKQIHSDENFKTVPNLFYQLFTLHLNAYKKVWLHNLFDWVQIIDIFFFT
jgi:hypothetical protein